MTILTAIPGQRSPMLDNDCAIPEATADGVRQLD